MATPFAFTPGLAAAFGANPFMPPLPGQARGAPTYARPGEFPASPPGFPAGMTPLQQRSYAATQGVSGAGFSDPSWYLNALLYTLTDPSGGSVEGASLLPIERQYLSQVYGIDPNMDLTGIFEALAELAGRPTAPEVPEQKPTEAAPREGGAGQAEAIGGPAEVAETPDLGLGVGGSGIAGLVGGPIGSLGAAIGGLLGGPGVIGPTTPQVGTPEFAGTVAAGRRAGAIEAIRGLDPDAPAGQVGGGGMGASTGADVGGSEGGVGCFVGETPISIPGGTKPISEVKCGDTVLSFDGRGQLKPARVVATMSREDAEIVVLTDGTKCTPDHRFLTDQNDYVPVSMLAEVSNLNGIRDDGRELRVEIDSEDTATVYNFTVEGTHTYVANGWRVHNIKHSGGYVSEQRKPGIGQDVAETLQEGEYVMSRAAVKAFGKEIFDALNKVAKRKR